jgi:chromate transporter
MLDGLGMAETTPGPLIMVLQFVGFMAAFQDPGSLSPALAGTLGGLLATWVTFTPCFLWIFLCAPFVEAMRGNQALSGALSAITAAVVGVILNLSIWFAIHTMFQEVTAIGLFGWSVELPLIASLDAWAVALASAALIAVFWYDVGILPLLAVAVAVGLCLRLVGALP